MFKINLSDGYRYGSGVHSGFEMMVFPLCEILQLIFNEKSVYVMSLCVWQKFVDSVERYFRKAKCKEIDGSQLIIIIRVNCEEM